MRGLANRIERERACSEVPKRTTSRVRAIRPYLVKLALGCSIPWVASCASMHLPTAGANAPMQHVVRASQYAFTTDFELDRDHRYVRELVELREEVYQTLRLPPGRDLVRVVIFETRDKYRDFLLANYPELPPRRAFFLKQGPGELVVFACVGERLREDLRHEITHALLHSTMADVPIWLDEGLAEYFEALHRGIAANPRHVQRLAEASRQGADFNLRRLEAMRDLWQVTAADYRLSWLWVHFSLHHSARSRDAFLAHVAAHRVGQNDSLAERIEKCVPNWREELMKHLAHLEELAAQQPPEPASPAIEAEDLEPRHPPAWARFSRSLRTLLIPASEKPEQGSSDEEVTPVQLGTPRGVSGPSQDR